MVSNLEVTHINSGPLLHSHFNLTVKKISLGVFLWNTDLIHAHVAHSGCGLSNYAWFINYSADLVSSLVIFPTKFPPKFLSVLHAAGCCVRPMIRSLYSINNERANILIKIMSHLLQFHSM